MARHVQTAVGLLAALAVTFICVLVTRAIDKRISEKQQHQDA
jgi:capsular polysaccharide biosynthesis protein